MKKLPLSEQLVGLLLIALLIILSVVGFGVLNRRDGARQRKLDEREHSAYVRDSLAHAIAERDSMRAVWAQQRHERDSLRPIWEAERAQREANRLRWAAEKAEREAAREAERNIEIILQPFDPNTADSTTLVHLGLRPWMARSVVHYREKGGRYRQKTDFRKAYGMTDSLYLVLEPYITLPDSLPKQSLQYAQKKDTVLNLNTADTTELQLIRGIGRYTAKRIVDYRRKLGGYVSAEQLRELTPAINGLDSILPHLMADPKAITPLYINRLSTDALMRHAYVSFEQAKAIREYRSRKGAIRSEAVLLTLKEKNRSLFSEADIERLRPYINYDE